MPLQYKLESQPELEVGERSKDTEFVGKQTQPAAKIETIIFAAKQY